MTVPPLPLEAHALTVATHPYPEDTTMAGTLHDAIHADIMAAVDAAVAEALDRWLTVPNLARATSDAVNAPQRPEPVPPPMPGDGE